MTADKQAREAAEKYANDQLGEMDPLTKLECAEDYLAGFQAATALSEESEKRAVAEAISATWKLAHDACINLTKSEFMAHTFIQAEAARKGTK